MPHTLAWALGISTGRWNPHSNMVVSCGFESCSPLFAVISSLKSSTVKVCFRCTSLSHCGESPDWPQGGLLFGLLEFFQARGALRYCWVSSLRLLSWELGLCAQPASQSPGGTRDHDRCILFLSSTHSSGDFTFPALNFSVVVVFFNSSMVIVWLEDQFRSSPYSV